MQTWRFQDRRTYEITSGCHEDVVECTEECDARQSDVNSWHLKLVWWNYDRYVVTFVYELESGLPLKAKTNLKRASKISNLRLSWRIRLQRWMLRWSILWVLYKSGKSSVGWRIITHFVTASYLHANSMYLNIGRFLRARSLRCRSDAA